jgi:hypothetical protein
VECVRHRSFPKHRRLERHHHLGAIFPENFGDPIEFCAPEAAICDQAAVAAAFVFRLRPRGACRRTDEFADIYIPRVFVP